MINIFDLNNVKEFRNKDISLAFYALDGACGMKGLFFVISKDNTIYAYSTYYKNSNNELIKDIINIIPELNILLSTGFHSDSKEKGFIYLGLGNMVIMKDEFLQKFNEYKNDHIMINFDKLLKDITSHTLEDIDNVVAKSLDEIFIF